MVFIITVRQRKEVKMLCVSQFIQNLTSWKTTLINSFLILISIPGMVSQVCVKVLFTQPQERRQDNYRKSFEQSIRISMFLFYADDYFKDVCYAAARRKYPSLL